MVKTEITKEQLKDYLFNMETINSGCYGVIKKVDEDTCVKIYYKDILDTYMTEDMDKLDSEITSNLEVKNEVESMFQNLLEAHQNEETKLEKLIDLGYINKVLYYRGYKIGIEMHYYRDYMQLYDAVEKMNKAQIKMVLQEIREKLDELISFNIFPTDLSTANILINLNNLDVVLIDLDDGLTRYDTDDYLQKKPLVKKNLISTCNERMRKIELMQNKARD